jgi:transposase
VSKPKKILRRLTDQDISDIRKKKAEGSTCKELSEIFGVSENTISRIARKLIYKDIG